VLLAAIEQLNPKTKSAIGTEAAISPLGGTSSPWPLGGAADLDPASQPYVILTNRFVASNRYSRYENIANKLAISKSTYYRKLDDAVALLLNILKRMEVDEGEDESKQPKANTDGDGASELLALPPTPNYEYFIGRDELVARIKQALSTLNPALSTSPTPSPSSTLTRQPSALGL